MLVQELVGELETDPLAVTVTEDVSLAVGDSDSDGVGLALSEPDDVMLGSLVLVSEAEGMGEVVGNCDGQMMPLL